MPSYSVLSNLKHDGKQYAKGDTVDMDAKTAKQLIDSDVLAKGKQASQAMQQTPQEPPTTDPDLTA